MAALLHEGMRRLLTFYTGKLSEAQSLYVRGGSTAKKGLAVFDRYRPLIDRFWQVADHRALTQPTLADLFVKFVVGLVPFGSIRYTPQERIALYVKALPVARQLQHNAEILQLLNATGWAYLDGGSAREALTWFKQQYELAQSLHDQEQEARASRELGNTYKHPGQLDDALSWHERHLAHARQSGDAIQEASATGNIGNIFVMQGKIEQGISCHKQHLAIARQYRLHRFESNALWNLANAYYRMGVQAITERAPREVILSWSAQARMTGEAHLKLALKLGDRRAQSYMYGILGNVYLNLEQNRLLAMNNHLQHRDLARQIGDREGEAFASWNIGEILIDEQRYLAALPFLEQCLEYEEALEHPDLAKDAEFTAIARDYSKRPNKPSGMTLQAIYDEVATRL